MPPSARWPLTTKWCPPSKACSLPSAATGRASMPRPGPSPNCPRPNARPCSGPRKPRMPDIHIEREHALGLAKARELAFKWAEQAEQKLAMECVYEEGKTADLITFSRSGVNGELRVTKAPFSRSGVNGELRVTKDRFALDARLGFLLGAFKSRIEAEVTRNLDLLLKEG